MPSPSPSASAHIHDAICACEASSVRAAWNTITAELAKPTSTVTKQAISAGSEASRHRERPAEEDIARSCRGVGGGALSAKGLLTAAAACGRGACAFY
ncbi:hypothetical protein NYQ44_06605 [Xanthomonas translucens pv. undulosa]|nr:hypothetical protein [Xanthomonas translucens pv. undulosa]